MGKKQDDDIKVEKHAGTGLWEAAGQDPNTAVATNQRTGERHVATAPSGRMNDAVERAVEKAQEDRKK